jgi:RHS repeat-associated protein
VKQFGAVNTATGTALLALNYDYYPGGDIRTRSDAVNARLEAFKYDGLDRLTGWSVSSTNGAFATRDTTYAYDLIGNLTNVTVGATTVDTAVYAGPRPHAITSLNNQTFSYDGRGRQLDGPKRTVTFNAFDLPKQVGDKATGRKAKYLYDADQNRVRKTDLDESITTHIGGVYERRWSKAGIEHVFMVPGEDGPAVQIVYREGGNDTLYHLSNDLHGSVSLVLSDALSVLERRYAEPFGGRVATDGQPLVPKPSKITRGFTGHEEERAIGLINMRGRIYDPAQRHFLTPDPLVSDPLFSQSYNRYSYVLNNPLRYTDPSGFTKEATTNSALEPPPAEAGGSWKLKSITQSGRTVVVTWQWVPDAPPAAPQASDDTGNKPEQTKPEQTKPEQTKPEQTKPEQAKPEQAKPEQRKPEQTKSEQRKPEVYYYPKTDSRREHYYYPKTDSWRPKPEQTKPEQAKQEPPKPEPPKVEVPELRRDPPIADIPGRIDTGTDMAAWAAGGYIGSEVGDAIGGKWGSHVGAAVGGAFGAYFSHSFATPDRKVARKAFK